MENNGRFKYLKRWLGKKVGVILLGLDWKVVIKSEWGTRSVYVISNIYEWKKKKTKYQFDHILLYPSYFLTENYINSISKPEVTSNKRVYIESFNSSIPWSVSGKVGGGGGGLVRTYTDSLGVCQV